MDRSRIDRSREAWDAYWAANPEQKAKWDAIRRSNPALYGPVDEVESGRCPIGADQPGPGGE